MTRSLEADTPRIAQLLREQVPVAWIAEETGWELSTIHKLRRRLGIPIDPDWKAIQLSIRKPGVLARLHAEIAPGGDPR